MECTKDLKLFMVLVQLHIMYNQKFLGDTDSLFVLMPSLSREEAFVIGRKIADDITAVNPYPMKMKFEKVMMPCCLIAKKR